MRSMVKRMKRSRNPLCWHEWDRVVDVDHSACGECFVTPDRISEELKKKHPEYRDEGFCPHSFKVCNKCGKTKGFGPHGSFDGLVPDICKPQIFGVMNGFDPWAEE